MHCHARSLAYSQKAPITYVMSVRPSCITSAPTGRIFVKSHIGDFYENLSRNSKYGQSRTKLSDTLQEDLSKFYCCRRQSVATKALLAATGGGEGEDRSTRHVTSQRRLCYNCEHRSLRGTNRVLYNEQSVVGTCITGDRLKLHFFTRFYSNSGQGIIKCISSSAHALLLAHGNKGYANAPQR